MLLDFKSRWNNFKQSFEFLKSILYLYIVKVQLWRWISGFLIFIIKYSFVILFDCLVVNSQSSWNADFCRHAFHPDSNSPGYKSRDSLKFSLQAILCSLIRKLCPIPWPYSLALSIWYSSVFTTLKFIAFF